MTKTTTITKVTPIDAVNAVLVQSDAVESLNKVTPLKMNTLLASFQASELDGERLIDTWDEVYTGNNWSYNEIDPDTGKATKVKGAKAPPRVHTYKSQMLSAFVVNKRTLTGIKEWADLKELIKKQDSQLEIDVKSAMTELQKVVKVAVKSGKINIDWIQQATKHIENNDGILD
jgi:hypothetical protein